MDWLLRRLTAQTRRTAMAQQLTDRIFPLLARQISQDVQRWSESRLKGYVRAKASRLIDESLSQLGRAEPRFVARYRANLWQETLELVTERVALRMAPPAPRIYRPAQAA
jgi:hypothetical protein